MFFEDFDEKFNTLIAKSADLTNKPFLHSVVNINGEYEKAISIYEELIVKNFSGLNWISNRFICRCSFAFFTYNSCNGNDLLL